MARVLAGRGVAADDAPAFLTPTLKTLMPDPSTLTDMDKAAARIADAIVAGEQIAIFGDYDVDGASSSALMARFLRHQGLDPRIYIPDRLFEGYGPNVEAMKTLAAGGVEAHRLRRLRLDQLRCAGDRARASAFASSSSTTTRSAWRCRRRRRSSTRTGRTTSRASAISPRWA